jgi:hypothetical protein
MNWNPSSGTGFGWGSTGNQSPYLQVNAQQALPGQYNSMANFGSNLTQDATQAGNFDWSGLMGNVGKGIGGLTSLAQLYGMFQNLGLQKKAFKFAQEGTKRNFNAQATGYNNQVIGRENAMSAYNTANPSADYGAMQSYGRVEKWG